MAQTVKLKRSAVAAKVPLTSDLALGELAVNTNDGVLYTLMNDGTNKIVQLGGQSVSATVTAGTNAQGQGPLTANVNIVNTTAANPSGVTLPTALQGYSVYVYNRGTNPVNVYPATGAQIDALGTNTSIQIAVGGWLQFNASSTTQWYSSFSASISLSANNAFTGANTFTNTTGQTFRQAATQDGILLRGRAGGTGSFTLEIVPATLTANSTFTIPSGTQSAATQERTNVFTALNTFSSSSGVLVFAGSSPTDGLILKGNAAGTGSFRATIQPATLSASRTFTIPNVDGTAITTGDSNTVTNVILAQVATSTFKGRATAGTGNVEDLTGTQATTLLDTFTSTLKGLAPASGGGTTNFLRADGTWAGPPGSTAAGSSGQVQYNSSGAFAGNANLTFNSGTGTLTAGGFTLFDGSLLDDVNGTRLANTTTGQYVEISNFPNNGINLTGPINFATTNRQFSYIVSGAGKVATLPDNGGGLIGSLDVGTVTRTMIAPGTVLKSNYGQVLAVQYGAAMP